MSDSYMYSKLQQIITNDSVVLFMRGRSSFSICGMSSHVYYWMKKYNVKFTCIDVLRDPELHDYLRTTHAPATAPYLYVNGRFVGGYEMLSGILERGEIDELYAMNNQSRC